MDNKHTTDILKTRGEIKEGSNGTTPALSQPKKPEIKFHISIFLTEDQIYWLCNYLMSNPSKTPYYEEFKEIIFKTYMPYLYRSS